MGRIGPLVRGPGQGSASRRGPRAARAAAAIVAWGMLLVGAGTVRAQDLKKELRDSQERLEQIRAERARLQRQMEDLRSRVHDVSGELVNIERQVETSSSVVEELDFQSATLNASVDSTTRRLLATRDQLAQRDAVLHRRLRSIYERGPMHSVRVLLGAESFGDLLNRYKYLHLIALNDRMLVDEVRRLETQLVEQDRELQGSLDQLQRLRDEKLGELTRLQALQSQHRRTLHDYQQRARRTAGRIDQLVRDEARLTDALAEIERKRKVEERRAAVAGAPGGGGGLTTRELGSLRWPVDGRLLYRFGPERRANGVILRNNGIGIAALAGAPVAAVEAGTVVMARPFEGYGPTVMISHGGGFYTLYLYLGSIAVKEGQHVSIGQKVGTVGGGKTPEGPHIEFQVRAPIGGDLPEAVDPLDWLRSHAGQ